MKKEKSELEYRKNKYEELEEEYKRRDKLHMEVNTNMQIELSQAKDKLKQSEKDADSYSQAMKDKDKCYRELNDKYNFVLWKLSNNPETQKQTDEMIKFYNYMTSHDRIAWPVLWFIAGVVISIILFSIL